MNQLQPNLAPFPDNLHPHNPRLHIPNSARYVPEAHTHTGVVPNQVGLGCHVHGTDEFFMIFGRKDSGEGWVGGGKCGGEESEERAAGIHVEFEFPGFRGWDGRNINAVRLVKMGKRCKALLFCGREPGLLLVEGGKELGTMDR